MIIVLSGPGKFFNFRQMSFYLYMIHLDYSSSANFDGTLKIASPKNADTKSL